MIEIVPADIYDPARCDCCGATGKWMVGMDPFYLCSRCISDAVKAIAEHKEKESQSMTQPQTSQAAPWHSTTTATPTTIPAGPIPYTRRTQNDRI